jgi:hypothetical protein
MRAYTMVMLYAAAYCVRGAPTELYFEFDNRATSASVSPGLFFCNAATSILTPTYASNDVWCLGSRNYSYVEYVHHGRLSNARLTLPESPVSGYDSKTNMMELSERLFTEGYFLSRANVTHIGNWNHSLTLNVTLTSLTFVILFASIMLTYFCSSSPSS